MTSSSHSLRWAPTAALGGAAVSGIVIMLAGVLWSRADVAALGLPLVVWAAYRWSTRPTHPATISHAVDFEALSSEAEELSGRLTFETGGAAASLHVRAYVGETKRRLALLKASDGAEVRIRMPLEHSGPTEAIRFRYRACSDDGAFMTEASPESREEHTIRPRIGTLPHLLLPRHLTGLTGAHESTRPGEGGEFRDIHPYAPGDRLRRIDWRATARLARAPGDIFVRRTHAASDATVMIVMDTSDDVGESVVEWASGRRDGVGVTSMDLARECATAIATSYTRAGDNVGLHDLTAGARPVRRGSGGKHAERLYAAIAATRASGASSYRRRAPVLPPGALVFVLSTFLDDDAADLAGIWAATGHPVIAIDVLPHGDLSGLSPEQMTAHRMLMLERDDRLTVTAASGVRIVRWHDDSGEQRSGRLYALSRERAPQ